MSIFTSKSLPEAAVTPFLGLRSLTGTGSTRGLASPTPKFVRLGKI